MTYGQTQTTYSAKCIVVDDPGQVDVEGAELMLLHLNIRSISAHLDEFELIVDPITPKPTLMCVEIGETWLSEANECCKAIVL